MLAAMSGQLETSWGSVGSWMRDEELHDLVSPDERIGRLAGEAEDLPGLAAAEVLAAREAVALGEGLRRRIVVLDELEYGS